MKLRSKFVAMSLISSLSMSLAFAGQSDTATATNYKVKIESKTPGMAIPFSGSYMSMQSNGSKIMRLDNVTPYEFDASGQDLGLMLMSMGNGSSEINKVKVTILVNGENRMSGEGISFLAHESSNGDGFITAR
jgi:hypothetical protein